MKTRLFAALLVLIGSAGGYAQTLDAAEGWAQIKRDLAAETYRFYVLDEFTYPMKWGWVDVREVVEVLVSTGEGRKDGATRRMSGRARDGRLVHLERAAITTAGASPRAEATSRPGMSTPLVCW